MICLICFVHGCNLNEVVTENPWTNGKQMSPGNDSILPDSVKSWLKEDACRLALRDVYSDPQSKNVLITLPKELVDFYYHGLVHVYNASSLAARDSVYGIFRIHTFRRPEMRSIIVAVDSIKSWVINWKNGNRLTGNSSIDSLMNTYNLQLDKYYPWLFHHAAVLYAEKPVNLFALGKKFETIDGILFTEENRTAGDGNDINAKIEAEYLSIEYSVGWGDCPAGCIHRRYWLFNVKFDGAVSFVRSYGDVLP